MPSRNTRENWMTVSGSFWNDFPANVERLLNFVASGFKGRILGYDSLLTRLWSECALNDDEV